MWKNGHEMWFSLTQMGSNMVLGYSGSRGNMKWIAKWCPSLLVKLTYSAYHCLVYDRYIELAHGICQTQTDYESCDLTRSFTQSPFFDHRDFQDSRFETAENSTPGEIKGSESVLESSFSKGVTCFFSWKKNDTEWYKPHQYYRYKLYLP